MDNLSKYFWIICIFYSIILQMRDNLNIMDVKFYKCLSYPYIENSWKMSRNRYRNSMFIRFLFLDILSARSSSRKEFVIPYISLSFCPSICPFLGGHHLYMYFCVCVCVPVCVCVCLSVCPYEIKFPSPPLSLTLKYTLYSVI